MLLLLMMCMHVNQRLTKKIIISSLMPGAQMLTLTPGGGPDGAPSGGSKGGFTLALQRC